LQQPWTLATAAASADVLLLGEVHHNPDHHRRLGEISREHQV